MFSVSIEWLAAVFLVLRLAWVVAVGFWRVCDGGVRVGEQREDGCHRYDVFVAVAKDGDGEGRPLLCADGQGRAGEVLRVADEDVMSGRFAVPAYLRPRTDQCHPGPPTRHHDEQHAGDEPVSTAEDMMLLVNAGQKIAEAHPMTNQAAQRLIQAAMQIQRGPTGRAARPGR